MRVKVAGKSIVTALVVALLAASPAALMGEDAGPGQGPGNDLQATYNDYTSVSTGLPNSGDYYFLLFGDVNGDGYDDIAVGAGQYPSRDVDTDGVYVYTSKAGKSWEKNSTGLSTNGNYAGIALGDLDGDKDLDLVAGGEGWASSSVKGISVYINNGTSGGKIDWDASTKPESNGYYDQLVIADVNEDGDGDIVAGTKGSGVRVWLGNGGSGGTWKWNSSNSGLPSNSEYCGVAVADMNKDGDLDILATDYSGSGKDVHLFTGDGTGNWTNRDSSFSAGSAATFGVAVGDVDKDGHKDIVYGYRGGIKCLLGNSGGTTGTNFSWSNANTNLPTGSGDYAQLALGDVDKDGDLDILAASVSNGVQIYLGNGGAGTGQSWTKVTKKLPSSRKFYGAALGDFNNDGVLDVGCAQWQDGTTGGVYAYKGSVVSDTDPTARAVWNGTTANETTSWLGDTVRLDGTNSSDPQDAPTGDSTGTKLKYDWNLTAVPAGSAVTDGSLSPDDKNATPSFTPDRVGVYRLSLAVNDSDGNWSTAEAFVKLEVRKPNDPPVAVAGPDQQVPLGELVFLNASDSYDIDGTVVSWQWNASDTNPATVTLVNATLPLAHFVAPSTLGNYTFTLRVRDDNDTWSDPDEVNVTVTLPPNVPPVAVAPNDFSARVTEVVRLNASSSYDPDGGTIVAWDWNCTSHPSLPITASDAEEASFTPVLEGVYTFSLTVRDDRGAWAVEDRVNVTVQDPAVNVPPVAEIVGAAVRSAHVGDNVSLDASPSRDDDGTIVQYLWNCTSHPSLAFNGQNTTLVYFRPLEPGDYVFTLAVRDDNDTWSQAEDSVTVQVTRPAENTLPVPVIIGRPDERYRPGDRVDLDGSTSYDPDGYITEFGWECISHPTLNFTGRNASAVMFIAPDEGDYTFTLSVGDDQGAWSVQLAYHTVPVKVNVPPVANITGPATGSPGENITLSAMGSADEDGEVVAWRWNSTSHPGLYINGGQNETMFFNASAAAVYVIVLVVQDDDGAWSQAVEWPVNITPIDQPPVADAGPDQTVRQGRSVSLDGGGSYDNEGPIVTWRWRCVSHPTVPGLLNTDQEVASFTPPDPGTFTFTLEVEDEAGQWSAPDTVLITVLKANSPPAVTIDSPKEGIVQLEGLLLRISWTATDANNDQLRFTVEIFTESGVFLARVGDRPHETTNVTFNDTTYNFPRSQNLIAKVTAMEINTEDRLETEVESGPFKIVDPVTPPPDGGGEEDEGLDMNMVILAIVLVLGVVLVIAMVLRRGVTDDDDQVPWEDEGRPEAAPEKKPQRSALATRGEVGAPPSVVSAEDRKAKATKGASEAPLDPKGRLLDCPDCGSPLDHDTDFGAPYCWDCDKYF